METFESGQGGNTAALRLRPCDAVSSACLLTTEFIGENEMKLALYRKYRPRTFSEVVGQEDVTLALRNQIQAGRFGHAYLFTGVRGTGKTSLAKILAKAVNCLNVQDGEPCGECDICKGIDNGSILDVTEIDAASNNRVDDVRDILEEVSYTPVVCKMRVYIIDEVHMLSTAAFNALLKTLEEPPAHVLFILATTEIQKVPATILSRCQRFDLKRIPEERIAQRLLEVAGKEEIDLQEPAANLIARLSDGALRDALSLLDTAASMGKTVDEETVKRLSGVTDKTYLFQLSDCVQSGNLVGVLGGIQQLYQDGAEPGRLLSELIRHYRNLLMVRVGNVTLRDCSDDMQARYQQASGSYTEEELLRALSRLSVAADQLTRSLDRETTFELALLELAGKGKGSYTAPKAGAPKVTPAKPLSTQPTASEKETPPWEAPKEEQPEPTAVQAEVLLEEEEPETPAVFDKSEEGLEEAWPQIVQRVREKQRTLGSLLNNSKPHLSGNHILIEASEMALTFIRENKESNQLLKDSITQVTGLQMPIGPWKAPTVSPVADRTLENLLKAAEENGIEVERK